MGRMRNFLGFLSVLFVSLFVSGAHAAESAKPIIQPGGTLTAWTVTGPETLTAQYTCNEHYHDVNGTCVGKVYTITLKKNDGTDTTVGQIYEKYADNFYTDEAAKSEISASGCGSASSCVKAPITSRTGYTFAGWYTAASGGKQIINADRYVASSSAATIVGLAKTFENNGTLYAHWTANTNTKYVVNHYTKELGKNTYKLAGTEERTGTTGAKVTLVERTKPIEGYTYTQGFAGETTNGTTKPTSGAVTTAEILANGKLVIDLYYTRKTYTITATAGRGVSKVAATGWTNTGTATMTKKFEYEAKVDLTTITPTRKNGYTGTKYETDSESGTLSGSSFTVGNGDATITVSAAGIDTPAGVTLTPTSITRVYNTPDEIALTAATTTTYDSGITVMYAFGTVTGSYTGYSGEGTTNTLTVSNNEYGKREYRVKVYATDGELTSQEAISDVASVTLNNKKITFNVGTCASATKEALYVSYNNAKLYTSETGTTEGSVPTASKTGYTFNGWYTSKSGGSQIYNASGTITSTAVSGYTKNSKWIATENKTLYARCTANTNTPYVVLHYVQTATGTNEFRQYKKVEKTGTTDATINVADLTTGMEGSGANASAVTAYILTEDPGKSVLIAKPVSGEITQATISGDGKLIIGLFYGIKQYTVTIKAGNGIATVAADGWDKSGTATMTKMFDFGATVDLSKITPENKTGYKGASYSGTVINDNKFTVGQGNVTITVEATGITVPAGVTLTPTTAAKVYNFEDTVLTAATTTKYDNAISVYYQFGEASASDGSYTYEEASTDNKKTVGKAAYRGKKYYKVKVYAKDNKLSTIDTPTVSSASSITLTNKKITFNANGGTLSGTSPLYTSYNYEALYTGETNGTAGTVPSATKSGYDFAGWYTAKSGGSRIYDSNLNLTSNTVEGYTSGGKWATTADQTLYAHWTAKTVAITLRNYNDSDTHSIIYEKYATGWYSNSNTTIEIYKADVPTRDGYTFRGFYTAKQADLTADGGSGTRHISADGTLPANTTFNTDKRLYAAWAKNCKKPTNGTCSLTINDDGIAKYTASCDAGYTVSNETTATPSCNPNCNKITLNKNGGAGGPDALYKKSGSTEWFTDSNCSTANKVTELSESELPKKDNANFNGYFE